MSLQSFKEGKSMATKKAASAKKATANKPAAAAKAKTTVRTLRADDKVVKPEEEKTTAAVAPATHERRSSRRLPNNVINIVFVELIGTFILTLVALTTAKDLGALYTGIAFAAVTLAIGAISGAHLNPAITVGVWAMRRLKSILLPFYIGAQFLGAMLAVIAINAVTNGSLKLDFSHFATFSWAMFGVELVGAIVLLFGFAAVRAHDLTNTGRALGAGLAVITAFGVAGTLYGRVYSADLATYQANASSASSTSSKQTEIPHSIYAATPVLNPATALAATEKTTGELMSGAMGKDDKQYSRLSLEVILGTLIGAAIGGNLYLVVAGRKQN